MNKPTLRLTVAVPALGFDATEWEPDAQIVRQNSTLIITQRVFKDGGVLFGATETFRESLSDLVSDTERFMKLEAL